MCTCTLYAVYIMIIQVYTFTCKISIWMPFLHVHSLTSLKHCRYLRTALGPSEQLVPPYRSTSSQSMMKFIEGCNDKLRQRRILTPVRATPAATHTRAE